VSGREGIVQATRGTVEEEIFRTLLRGAAYRALALGFAYPSSAVLGRLNAQWSALRHESLPWSEEVKRTLQTATDLLQDADGEALEREHVRLFGPAARCSLHETAYGDAGRLLGKPASLADISGFYMAFGLHPTTGDAHPEDHISLELEFMSLLSLKEAYALAKGWHEHLDVTRDAQRKFAQDHLGTWIDALAEQLRACDPHPFYAALGEALQRVVRAEVTRLKASPVPVGGCVADTEMGGETLVCPRATSDDQAESASSNA
jgi:DMSO reductase family type II enzyme chaperone